MVSRMAVCVLADKGTLQLSGPHKISTTLFLSLGSRWQPSTDLHVQCLEEMHQPEVPIYADLLVSTQVYVSKSLLCHMVVVGSYSFYEKAVEELSLATQIELVVVSWKCCCLQLLRWSAVIGIVFVSVRLQHCPTTHLHKKGTCPKQGLMQSPELGRTTTSRNELHE